MPKPLDLDALRKYVDKYGDLQEEGVVALIDELTEARRTLQWQPIAAAAKDGSYILADHADYGVPVAALWQMNFRVGAECWTDLEDALDPQPTHFMPLPDRAPED